MTRRKYTLNGRSVRMFFVDYLHNFAMLVRVGLCKYPKSAHDELLTLYGFKPNGFIYVKWFVMFLHRYLDDRFGVNVLNSQLPHIRAVFIANFSSRSRTRAKKNVSTSNFVPRIQHYTPCQDEEFFIIAQFRDGCENGYPIQRILAMLMWP